MRSRYIAVSGRLQWGEKDVVDGLRWMEVTWRNGFWVPAAISPKSITSIWRGGERRQARACLEQAGDAAGAESAPGVAKFHEHGEVITKDPKPSGVGAKKPLPMHKPTVERFAETFRRQKPLTEIDVSGAAATPLRFDGPRAGSPVPRNSPIR